MSFQAVAVPYDTSANAFYFKCSESFERKESNQFNCYGDVVEEFEIELINACSATFEFNKVFDLQQGNVSDWFEYLDRYLDLSDCEQVAFLWLCENIKSNKTYAYECINYAFDNVNDVCVIESSISDYVYDLVDEMEGLSEFAKMYFDYEALARDMEINSEIIECGDYLIINAQCI